MTRPSDPAGASPHALSALGDNRRFWNVFAFLLGSLAVLKGFREPIPWAMTQASLDYHVGFIKRGLHGAVLHVAGLHHAAALHAVLFAELALFYVALATLLQRSLLVERTGDARLLALFASSYAITMDAALVGYSDILNGFFTICLLLLRKPSVRFVVAIPVVLVCVLTSENYLLMWLPVLLLSFVVDAFAAIDPGGRRAALLEGAALAVVAAGLVVAVAAKAHWTTAQAEAMRRDIAAQSDFALEPFVYTSLTWSMRFNMHVMLRYVVVTRAYWMTQMLGLILCGPVAVILLRAIHRLLRASVAAGPHSRWLLAALVVAVPAPLLLHMLAWDLVRFDCNFVMQTMLVLAVLSRTLPTAPVQLSRMEQNVILVLIALNMASGYGLFGAPVNPFPFYPRIVPGVG